MAPIRCTAPDCEQEFQEDLDPAVLLRLIDLHSGTAHALPAQQAPAPTAKAERVKRPTIAASGTSEDWEYFTRRWQTYKEATKLTGADVIYQLLETCDEPLRKDLSRTHGTLTHQTEDRVLTFIRTLAVRPENTMVERVKLQQMRQNRDEPVRSYCARLRGQASVCKFLKPCACEPATDVDYSSEIVRDCFIRGLSDEDIKLEILGQPDQEMTLEETLQIAEAKESGKRSADRLQENPSVTASMNSSYKKRNRFQPQHSKSPSSQRNPPHLQPSNQQNQPQEPTQSPLPSRRTRSLNGDSERPYSPPQLQPPSPSRQLTDTPPAVLPPVEVNKDTSHAPPLPKEPETRIPLALRQLQSYNAPGLAEKIVTPIPEKRVTRQSMKK